MLIKPAYSKCKVSTVSSKSDGFPLWPQWVNLIKWPTFDKDKFVYELYLKSKYPWSFSVIINSSYIIYLMNLLLTISKSFIYLNSLRTLPICFKAISRAYSSNYLFVMFSRIMWFGFPSIHYDPYTSINAKKFLN